MSEARQLLLKKILIGECPPLVIITPHSETNGPENFLNNWMKEFITEYLSLAKKIDKSQAKSLFENTHPDIAIIKKPESGKAYALKNNDLEIFFSIHLYKNWELPTRIIVIERADLIPEVYANKMLKTLEEPTERTITVLLNPYSKKMLSTIQSRSITLRLSKLNNDHKKIILKNHHDKISSFLNCFSENEEQYSVLKEIMKNDRKYYKLPQLLKDDPEFRDKLFSKIIEIQSFSNIGLQQYKQFTNELNWFYQSKTYNGMELERFIGLIKSFRRDESRQEQSLSAY